MSSIQPSRLAYGCMRIAEDRERGKRAVRAAIDAGYTLFDHADIYGDGQSEYIFGAVLRESPGLREKILIQGKCGVRWDPSHYDNSREHILKSTEDSLARLGIDQLDMLLVHRPDYLMDAREVSEAFAALKAAGKVVNFGVSNFSVSQFDLLQSALPDPMQVNQVEINLHNIEALENGVLDQCQRLGITPQAWCPLAVVAYPAWGNTFSEDDEVRIRNELERQSQIYGVEPWIVALAWLLRHPARISPIIGSTTPARILAANTALDIDYSRKDWYRLLEARNNQRLP